MDENKLPDENREPAGAEDKKSEEYCPSIFDKPDYSYQKPPKSRKLSRRTANIVIACVVCVALAAGTFAVGHFWKKDDSNTSSSSDTESSSDVKYAYDYNHYLSSNEDTDALKLGGVIMATFKNGDLEFTVAPNKKTVETTNSMTLESEQTEKLEWNISAVKNTDIEGVIFDPDRVNFAMANLLQMSYTEIYAEDSHAEIPQGGMTYYEECGFNRSTVRATADFADGSSVTAVVGDKTPTGDEVFVCVESTQGPDTTLAGVPVKDNRIYRVASNNIKFFEKGLDYFVELSLIEALEDQTSYDAAGNEVADGYFQSGELAYFDALSVSGKNFKDRLVFENCDVNEPSHDSIYLMTSPYTQNVNVDAMATLLSPLSEGFSADSCAVIKATGVDLSEYGFNDPECVVSYRVRKTDYVIRLGKQVQKDDPSDSTTYYSVMVGSNPSIFLISADSVKFATTDAEGYSSNTVYSCDIAKIKTLTVKINGKTTAFTLNHGESDDDMTVTANGKTLDTKTFREMYVSLLSMNSFSHVSDGRDAADPYVEISFTYNDYSRVDTLRFSPYTDRRYFMSLNGSGSTVVLSTAVDSFVKSVDTVLSTGK